MKDRRSGMICAEGIGIASVSSGPGVVMKPGRNALVLTYIFMSSFGCRIPCMFPSVSRK